MNERREKDLLKSLKEEQAELRGESSSGPPPPRAWLAIAEALGPLSTRLCFEPGPRIPKRTFARCVQEPNTGPPASQGRVQVSRGASREGAVGALVRPGLPCPGHGHSQGLSPAAQARPAPTKAGPARAAIRESQCTSLPSHSPIHLPKQWEADWPEGDRPATG